MFMKQYNYKPRSSSVSSTGSQSGSQSPETTKTDNNKSISAAVTGQTGGGPAAGFQGRRRSSASATDKFAGLSAHKRNSQDADAAAKKANWADQKPGGQGILGGMWNSFTKGS